MELKRSWMFVPGHRQKMVDKALGLNADAIMLDIEDGVAPNEKDTARRQIAEALGRERAPQTPARFVRINAIGHARMNADVDAVVRPGLDGLVLPKVETADDIRQVEAFLNEREPTLQMARGGVQLLVAVESPRGLLNAPAIAASSARIVGLMFGAEDYGREMGLPTKREGEAQDLIYARSAGQSRRLGFSGMSLIHPSQIDPINATFSPTAEEIDYAKQVLQAFEEANARGDGSIAFGGQLIDRPIVERARRTLELAKTLGIQA